MTPPSDPLNTQRPVTPHGAVMTRVLTPLAAAEVIALLLALEHLVLASVSTRSFRMVMDTRRD